MKTGKRYTEAAKTVDRSVKYSEADAISLVKKNATAKFDETIELTSRQVVIPVMQISRFVVLSSFRPAQVRR